MSVTPALIVIVLRPSIRRLSASFKVTYATFLLSLSNSTLVGVFLFTETAVLSSVVNSLENVTFNCVSESTSTPFTTGFVLSIACFLIVVFTGFGEIKFPATSVAPTIVTTTSAFSSTFVKSTTKDFLS
ncbi:Uncharacterised protein [Streptococcus pneumoniae]|nr:Uncharacterised protein [Streptococcus pneumoniae]CKG55466.1 Uncharacterised protein [Streptococcus pneumoniae]